MQACCGDSVDVASTSKVTINIKDSNRKAPLLSTELVITPEGDDFAYSTAVETIHQKIIAVFDRAILKLQVSSSCSEMSACAHMPLLECILLDSMFHFCARAGEPNSFTYMQVHSTTTSDLSVLLVLPSCWLQGLTQLEPAIMDRLFWPSTPLLNSVHLQEEHTVRARDALSGCLLASLQPLHRWEGLLIC